MNNQGNKRRRILDSAAKLFVEHGYEAAAVSRIVKGAGIAQGTFYLYFPSKRDVFLALAEEFVEELVDRMLEQASTAGFALERVEAAARAMAAHMTEHADLVGLMHTAVAESMVHVSEVRSRFRRLGMAFAEWLREGMEAGELRQADPQLTAYFVFTLMHESLERSFLMDYPGSPEETVVYFMDFVGAALRPELSGEGEDR